MLSRSFSLRLIKYQFRRFLHCGGALRENHYETLQISSDATASEVKKAFYTLSKTCHPDCNPNDSQASTRFIALSAAYSVLSIPSKRSSYDQTLFSSSGNQAQSSTIPRNSRSSMNPAGGRSPSGLSRRKAQFRGPPASFYRNGGWGAYGEKRSTFHKESMFRSKKENEPNLNQRSSPGESYTRSSTDSFQYKPADFVPHFDTERHLRMHEGYQERLNKRSSGPRYDVPPDSRGSFVSIVGILVVGIGLPVIYISASSNSQRGPIRKSNSP